MDAKYEDDGARAHDRSALGFSRAVQVAFAFLTSEHGFQMVEAGATCVRYESKSVTLVVVHDAYSYELGVDIALRSRESGSYGLRDVLAVALGTSLRQSDYFFQSSKTEGVRTCVDEIASLVRLHYGPLLNGDATTFRHLDEVTARRRSESIRELVEHPVRQAAQLAWEAKDLAAVARLYGSIREGLTLVERRRLEYAEERQPS